MKHLFKLLIAVLVITMFGCKNAGSESGNSKTTNDYASAEFSISGVHNINDSVLLRVAFLGDAEPKPLAEFPNMAAAVEDINTLALSQPIDFVIGVGDIAHKGTDIQYEAATPVLQQLTRPFYPIMGNEEHGSTVDKFIKYANMWNSQIVSPSYVIKLDQIAFVFASPDKGRDFDNRGARRVLDQIERLAPKPVILIVHGAQKGVYPENRKKGIGNRLFRKEVIVQPNLAAVISGDLHMDMDRVDHSKQIKNVHYLHIPALERTKIPDETQHTPMFRVMTILKSGKAIVDTYVVGESQPRKEHAYSFTISLQD